MDEDEKKEKGYQVLHILINIEFDRLEHSSWSLIMMESDAWNIQVAILPRICINTSPSELHVAMKLISKKKRPSMTLMCTCCVPSSRMQYSSFTPIVCSPPRSLFVV
jgi:hypothetical protein